MVIKKDGRREAFDRNKVFNGILRACEKRPVPVFQIEKIVDEIERGLNNIMEKEVRSNLIGEVIMEHLKELDEVAYVRFASVYRQFKDRPRQYRGLSYRTARTRNRWDGGDGGAQFLKSLGR